MPLPANPYLPPTAGGQLSLVRSELRIGLVETVGLPGLVLAILLHDGLRIPVCPYQK